MVAMNIALALAVYVVFGVVTCILLEAEEFVTSRDEWVVPIVAWPLLLSAIVMVYLCQIVRRVVIFTSARHYLTLKDRQEAHDAQMMVSATQRLHTYLNRHTEPTKPREEAQQ